jgi:two-component system sensor histidine kinase DesK
VTADRSDRQGSRRIAQVGWVGIWLVFLGSPLAQVWKNGTVGKILGTADIVAFAILYLAVFITSRRSWAVGHDQQCSPDNATRRYSMLAGLVALTLLAIPFAHGQSLTMVVYTAAASMFTLSMNLGVLAVLVLAAGTEISARTIDGWHNQQWSVAFSTVFAGAAVYASRIAFGRNRDLMAAREQMAQMAIEEERSRMTRDLHDILGHSLTVITIKAELAGRLVGTNDDRAAAEVADIERLAREALTDVRATIAGRREVSLAPELVNARSALASANIAAEVPNAVDDVPAANRELFGWAVREGVTNVLRHSKASRCVIRLTGTTIEIHDDGVGADPADADGNGLRGLRERVANAGGSIVTATSPELGGFVLKLSTPGGERDA